MFDVKMELVPFLFVLVGEEWGISPGGVQGTTGKWIDVKH